jgi:dethiobiotin synthetase
LTTALMQRLQLPVLLVARSSLGTINHTLLSVAALRDAALEIRGVIMVGKPNKENRKAIEHYGKVKVIGLIPPLRRLNRAALLGAYRNYFDRRALVE